MSVCVSVCVCVCVSLVVVVPVADPSMVLSETVIGVGCGPELNSSTHTLICPGTISSSATY